MTDAIGSQVLGARVDRVGGPLKVTGAAPYPSDVTLPGLVHVALVHATMAVGTITRIDTAPAEAAPGVLAVITHQNALALTEGPMTQLGPSPQFPLKDNRVLYHRQPVAVVVARTREQATSAARLIELWQTLAWYRSHGSVQCLPGRDGADAEQRQVSTT